MSYCRTCGRAISPTNEQAGMSCRGCLTEWLAESDPESDELVVPPRPFNVYACDACGIETTGSTLCLRCDDFANPYRLV